jgi:hypothetical protein
MTPRPQRRTLQTVLACLLGLALSCSSADQPKSVPGLRIISPRSGTVVHPGDAVTVTVVPENGVRVDAVYLLAHGPLVVTPSRPITKPPYDFIVSAPTDVSRAGLCSVFASGVTGKSVIASAATFLDVEPVGPIARLEVHPTPVRFFDLGSEQDLRATAKLADGTWMNVTQSSEIRYLGINPKVATVSNAGLVPYTMNGKSELTVSDGGRVKSLAYGRTEIVVTFRDNSVAVPVIVCQVGERCISSGHATSGVRAHAGGRRSWR